eukprot:COSAG04_NODE_11891_length_682_cov_1.442539_1_plen_121_part_10
MAQGRGSWAALDAEQKEVVTVRTPPPSPLTPLTKVHPQLNSLATRSRLSRSNTRASTLYVPEPSPAHGSPGCSGVCAAQDLASELQSASELGLELAQETITCLSAPEEEGGGGGTVRAGTV